MIIKCEHCGYQWDTKSELEKISCPNCNRKTSRKFEEEIKKEGENGSGGSFTDDK